MKGTVLILSGAMAVAATGAAQEASKPAQESKPAVQTRPAPSPAPAEGSSAATARVKDQAATNVAKRPTLLWFIGEFRAVDLDKRTLSFATDEGKSYTVAAQRLTQQETRDRAAQLAAVLKPGDRIRMLCSVNEKGEPIMIRSLHMISPTAPMQYR